MKTNFIQVPTTGSYSGHFNMFKLTVPGAGQSVAKLTLIPLKSFDASGIATKNTYLSYLGFESGRYPCTLDVNDSFGSGPYEKVMTFNPMIQTSGIYWYGAPGDGLYYWIE